MSCRHDGGFDWTDAELDRRNGGWKVRCNTCGEVLTIRRLATPESIQRDVRRNGPKVHMSKKERLRRRREAEELVKSRRDRQAEELMMRKRQADVEA